MAFDRRIKQCIETADYGTLCGLTTKELHESGEHELLNWMVLMGAVAPARGRFIYWGEMGRITLAAGEWEVA